LFEVLNGRGNQQEDANMFANFATAITSSTAVTLALLYVMNLLIGIQPQALVEPRERTKLDWIHVPDPEEPPETIKQKLKRETFEPPVPPITEMTGDPETGPGYSVPPAPPPPVGKYNGPGTLIQDGPLVALVRVSPTYPARAQQSGLEGWVLVQFDVLATGTVANIRVVESSATIFEDAARRAAARFRYKPRVIDGVAIETSGIQNLFSFHMED
jgi:protein TonB